MTERHPHATLGQPKVKITKQIVIGRSPKDDYEVLAFTSKNPIAVFAKKELSFICFQGSVDGSVPRKNETILIEKWQETAFDEFVEFMIKSGSPFPILVTPEKFTTLSSENFCKKITKNDRNAFLFEMDPAKKLIAVSTFNDAKCVYLLLEKPSTGDKKEFDIAYCRILPTHKDDLAPTNAPLEILEIFSEKDLERGLQRFIKFSAEDENFITTFLLSYE